jgi:hypothetical protein
LNTPAHHPKAGELSVIEERNAALLVAWRARRRAYWSGQFIPVDPLTGRQRRSATLYLVRRLVKADTFLACLSARVRHGQALRKQPVRRPLLRLVAGGRL